MLATASDLAGGAAAAASPNQAGADARGGGSGGGGTGGVGLGGGVSVGVQPKGTAAAEQPMAVRLRGKVYALRELPGADEAMSVEALLGLVLNP